MPKAAVKGKYYNLPHLDVLNQPQVTYNKANDLKKELRLAINAARVSESNMEDVIKILEHSLRHILQLKARKKRQKQEETANA